MAELLEYFRVCMRGVRTLARHAMVALNLNIVRAISLDVTGTILVHRYPIFETYAAAARWAQLPNPPTPDELKPAFKTAYKANLLARPCFGAAEGLSARAWWAGTVRSALDECGRGDYTDDEFARFFRRVYQHYGSPEGYERLPDAAPFLRWAGDERGLLLGVTTNTPTRTMETVLPMVGFHEHFNWFTCCQDVGAEKPDRAIFDRAFDEARFWLPDLERAQVLHVGDSLEADFCGARAAGFQALLLDRSDNPKVRVYQDWLDAPDYPGKSDGDIAAGTVKDLAQVKDLLVRAGHGSES